MVDTVSMRFAEWLDRGLCVDAPPEMFDPDDPVDIRRLQRGGSLFLTRPGLVDNTSTREELLWRGQEIMNLVASGDLEVNIHERYPLTEAPAAHRALQSRQTTGKLLLIP